MGEAKDDQGMARGGAGFELEDQSWFPEYLRRMQTEYIGWLVEVLGVYAPLATELGAALSLSGGTTVVDLCSGNGGPIRTLARSSALAGVRFILTDAFPSPAGTGAPNIAWEPAPVDALSENVPPGFRSCFNAYHHFSEQEKVDLLRIHGRQGLLVAEILRPTPVCFLQVLLTTTVLQVLLCPFVKPFRWDRLLFTWLLPVNLLTVTWDGLVSVFRVDGPSRLAARSSTHAPPEVTVRSGVHGPWWARVSWALLIPARA
jgi:hypothetical protein